MTIDVTDVDEPPAAPSAPSVEATAGSATRLEVSWSAPDNAGRPAIASYDLRYCAGSATECDTDGDFTDGPQDVPGTRTTAALTGLTPGTEYQVQVRATNDEGDSDWSASGTDSTANSAPVFADATLTRSIAENTPADVNVGASVPAATDADGDPLRGGWSGGGCPTGSSSLQRRPRARRGSRAGPRS